MPQARYSPQKYLVLNFPRPFIPDSQAGRAYPLPNLEEFSFSGWITSKDERDICRLLVDALTARRTSSSSSQGQGKPLRSFILNTDKDLQPSVEVKRELERLVADGLDIRILCAGRSLL